jgi:NAD(P)-dependent dehydrogenase (short-subunit alcohol dehydrogenase family)
MLFSGKSIIVTGGARGIGLAIVELFAREGGTVSVLDIEPSTPSTDASGIHTYTGNVTNAADVTRFVESVVARTGRVDVLVNNAGIIRDNIIWRMSEDDFDAVLNVNLKGPWLLCKQVAPVMKQQQSGRIVNIVSRAWLGNPGQSNYSSSKGGLVSLTRVLALELARYRVTVNAVAPGLIDTEMTRNLPADTLEKLVAAQPGKRIGTPEDVANAVAFLASDMAGFITGHVLYVDGGKHIGASAV